MPKLGEFLAQVHPKAVFMLDQACNLEFHSVSTDSRTLSPGALFFALSGPHFDANTFVAAAKARGAVAAVVTRMDDAMRSAELPMIQVQDSLVTLQQWARYWRCQWLGRLVAVTGSNGKTTVKQMIASIFVQAVGSQRAWATPGNLNNQIGVPLSVLGLSPAHQLAVLELGMNHPNEIAGLADIALPRVAVVTNAQREHQEFMKSVAAAARENGQVFKALPDDGVAVFPQDAAHEPIWVELAASRRMIRFGFGERFDDRFNGTEVLGVWQKEGASGQPVLRIMFPNKEQIDLRLRGLGEHFARNAMAAAACAYALDIALPVIALGLNTFEPVQGRGQRHALPSGGVLIDDSYNANPDSVRAAIDALATMPAPHALVLGDMGEVGDQGEAFHQEVLQYANQKAISSIWLHGAAFERAAQRLGIGRHFGDLSQLIDGLRAWSSEQQSLRQLPSVWVKGSRFMKMERVVQALTSTMGEAATCS